MKKILIGLSLLCFLHSGCKKELIQNEKPKSTCRLVEMRSLASLDFCNIVNDEKRLDFGLDRDTSANNYVFTQSQLNEGLLNLHAHFKYKDFSIVQNLDSSKQTLSIQELYQMFYALQYDTSVHYNPDSNYSALRLHFGMEGKKLILIYEPVILIPTTVPKECSVSATDQYYRIDSVGNFINISNTECAYLLSNLRSGSSKIHILHPNNSTVFHFINTSDASGDIRSNIITYQQIAKMYCDNTQGISSSDRINFTIVANQNATLTSNYRMHVVPNFRIGLSSAVSGTYKNYAADYLEMCPIKCNIVSINFYD